MKKNIISAFIILFLITLGSYLLLNDDSPYPKGGRDTVVEFGDRRFVILKGYKPSEEGNVKYYLLYDQKTDETIEYEIYNYKIEKPYAYTVGYNGYTKLNYNTGEYKQSIDLSAFNKDDQEIFKKVENGDPLS